MIGHSQPSCRKAVNWSDDRRDMRDVTRRFEEIRRLKQKLAESAGERTPTAPS